MDRDTDKSIVLIGFMGAGKTTAGELAAKKLNRRFIDTDLEIEKNFGMPVTEIFEKHGEQTFRTYEKNFIYSKIREKGRVISLGGGAFINEETRMACMDQAIVIFLDITWEAWKGRYEQLIDTRPILQERKLEEIKTLFYDRKNIYAHHHFKILMDGLSPEEAADKIVEVVLNH